MNAVRSRPRSLLLAALCRGNRRRRGARLGAAAGCQSGTAYPAAPASLRPAWRGPGSQPLIGPAVANLAPVAPPPIPTPADKLPLAKPKVPKGLQP